MLKNSVAGCATHSMNGTFIACRYYSSTTWLRYEWVFFCISIITKQSYSRPFVHICEFSFFFSFSSKCLQNYYHLKVANNKNQMCSDWIRWTSNHTWWVDIAVKTHTLEMCKLLFTIVNKWLFFYFGQRFKVAKRLLYNFMVQSFGKLAATLVLIRHFLRAFWTRATYLIVYRIKESSNLITIIITFKWILFAGESIDGNRIV